MITMTFRELENWPFLFVFIFNKAQFDVNKSIIFIVFFPDTFRIDLKTH